MTTPRLPSAHSAMSASSTDGRAWCGTLSFDPFVGSGAASVTTNMSSKIHRADTKYILGADNSTAALVMNGTPTTNVGVFATASNSGTITVEFWGRTGGPGTATLTWMAVQGGSAISF